MHKVYPINEIPLITEEAKEKLIPQLHTLEKGRDTVFRSPFFKDYTVDEIVNKFEPIINKAVELYPTIQTFEEANKEKRSSMSVMAPFKVRKEALEQYFVDPGGDVSDDELLVACNLVNRFLHLDQVHSRFRMMSLSSAMDRLPSTTNWALPYLDHGKVLYTDKEIAQSHGKLKAGDVKQDNRPKYLKLAEEMITDFSHEGWDVPCMMYWRGDLSKDSLPKQRVVWGYPHAVSIIESAIYTPLTRYFQEKSLPGFSAWKTFSATVHAVRTGMQACWSKGFKLYSWDASAFDQHLNEKLILAVNRNIVQPLFQEGERKLIERACLYSMRCGIVTPEGVWTGRNFNRPSGSGGTNFNDSLENLVMGVVIKLRMGMTETEILEYMNTLLEVNGDDKGEAVPQNYDTDIEKEQYDRAFGAKVNEGKKNISDTDLDYLKRKYIPDYEGAWYSYWRTIFKSINYEHTRPKGWSKYADSIRIIAQLNNIFGQPNDREFIQMYIDEDEFGLGTKLPGGPIQLFKLASQQAPQGLDELLGTKAWAGEYAGLKFKDPSEFAGIPIVNYLFEVWESNKAS